MKLATFQMAGERRVGLVEGDTAGEQGMERASVRAFDLAIDATRDGIAALIHRELDGRSLPRLLSPVPLGQVTLEAPIPLPHRNIFCVGKNYHDHAAEFAGSGFDSSAPQGAVPPHPIIFSKLARCVIATEEPILIDPAISTMIDYEAELGVIVGKGGRAIPATQAMDHVWGYTIINDVTARDLQKKHSQWLIGKSQDTFCPMGPFAVTRDDVDLDAIGVRAWVNDELRQQAPVSELIFDVPTLIETLSAGITLEPGDIIATGTPAGVGIGFEPPRFLRDGDRVRVAIDGLGELQNPVRTVSR